MTDQLTPEDMTDWQSAMSRLDAAQLELTHAQEVAAITNRMIARVYGLTAADKVDSDGTIHRAPTKREPAAEPPPAPDCGTCARYESLESFAKGQRVWVHEVDAGDEFHALRHRQAGTVARIPFSDNPAWVALDTRLTGDEAALHPFDDATRGHWVLTYPDKCAAMEAQAPDATASAARAELNDLEALEVEELEP